jgi:hypothetical protein
MCTRAEGKRMEKCTQHVETEIPAPLPICNVHPYKYNQNGASLDPLRPIEL